MTYVAFHNCNGCRNTFTKMYRRWPFLRDFWAYCPFCKHKGWPTAVFENDTGKMVQRN